MEKINTKEVPNEPGIYVFKDKYEEPLYVGKAKNLRKRKKALLALLYYYNVQPSQRQPI